MTGLTPPAALPSDRRLSSVLFVLCILIGLAWSALGHQSERDYPKDAVDTYEQLFRTQLSNGSREAAAETVRRCLEQFPSEPRCKSLVAELRRAASVH